MSETDSSEIIIRPPAPCVKKPWVAYWHKVYSMYWYFNLETGESQWDHPEEEWEVTMEPVRDTSLEGLPAFGMPSFNGTEYLEETSVGLDLPSSKDNKKITTETTDSKPETLENEVIGPQLGFFKKVEERYKKMRNRNIIDNIKDKRMVKKS